MTTATSLLELLLNLLRDPDALAAYQDDPEGYLSQCGDYSPEDMRDALVLLRDEQEAGFDREYNSGGNHVHVPPPADPPNPEPGESDHEAGIRYLNTDITKNHIDDRDTITDNSVNQQIDTDGGDFDQDIDVDSTVASGDGAVAAGDDIEDSTIVSGDDNQVGDDNVRGDGNVVGDDNEAVTGDDNTTSFGSGDATSDDVDGDLSVDDGSALGVGGDAGVDNSDNSLENVGNETADSNDYVDNSVDDSFNRETEDSFNRAEENTDNSEHHTEDSFNHHVG